MEALGGGTVSYERGTADRWARLRRREEPFLCICATALLEHKVHHAVGAYSRSTPMCPVLLPQASPGEGTVKSPSHLSGVEPRVGVDRSNFSAQGGESARGRPADACTQRGACTSFMRSGHDRIKVFDA